MSELQKHTWEIAMSTFDKRALTVRQARQATDSVMRPQTFKRWFTKNEAARYLCISTRQLDRLVAAGHLRVRGRVGMAARRLNRKPRYHIDDLEAYLTGRKTRALSA